MPSIIFDGWREEGKRYWYGGTYIYKYEVSVKWTVYNDLNTAIFLLPRITGFGVDTGYLQGNVINPNQTYNGECGHEFDWIPGAESDVTVEYVYSLDSFKPPYYNLGSASKHVIMPSYPEQPAPPPTEATVTLYTEPALSDEEAKQVSAQLNSYTLTVGKGVWVPIGSTFTLTVTSLPSGYRCTGAYGTGGISISNWTVTVNGDGNIVLQLTPTGAPPPTVKPSLGYILPIIVGATLYYTSTYYKRGGRYAV
jgi:hypothetical protein